MIAETEERAAEEEEVAEEEMQCVLSHVAKRKMLVGNGINPKVTE